MRLLVAGGAGFIGSNYARLRLDRHGGDTVRVLDKLTYAGRRENLDGLPEDRLALIEADIADRDAVRAALDGCDVVVNFAAAFIPAMLKYHVFFWPGAIRWVLMVNGKRLFDGWWVAWLHHGRSWGSRDRP